MRKLATIRKVASVTPIEGADKIELIHIDGWQCVSAKGQIKEGQFVVYFEIDSALPADDARYAFLHDRCLKKWMNAGVLVKEVIRIKTIKLRGVLSQGLAMPLEEFPELKDNKPGDDVTEILRVQHYDELAEECGRITGKAKLAGNAKGNFPVALVHKTDEERLQNLPEYFDGRFEDEEFEVTEKFDGSSATYIYAPLARPAQPFFVCSRNLELKEEEGNLYWDIAKKYDILNKLAKFCWGITESGYIAQVAIQGEIVGPGVNNNRDQYTEHEFRVFRMYDVTNQDWWDPGTRFADIEQMGLPHVKVINPRFKAFKELRTMEAFLDFVKGKTDRGHEREGMVFKSIQHRDISFKVINNDYLLKQKE